MIVMAGNSRNPTGYRFARACGLIHWTIGYNFRGAVEWHSGERHLRMGADCLVITPPNTPYDFVTTKSASEVWAIFEPRPAILPFLRHGDEPVAARFISLPGSAYRKRIRTAMDEFYAWWTHVPRQHALAENALERAIMLGRLAQPGHAASGLDARIAAALQYATENHAEVLTVAVLAAQANLSPSRFAHLFRAHTGITPMQFLEHRRLERAQQLLLFTRESIQEIATRVGFANPFHFSTRFRKLTRQSPREFRLHPRQG